MLAKLKLAAIATACWVSSAQAETHIIVLTGLSYFPAITYAQPGDTVIFINESGQSQTIVAKQADWTIGPLAIAEESSLQVTQETELQFYPVNCTNPNDQTKSCGLGGSNARIKPKITFDPPPLDR